MAGEIGLDEGGVLEALSKPFLTRKVTYSKNGKVQGYEDEYNVSMATIVALAVLMYGPQAMKWFSTAGGGKVGGFLENLGSGANVEGLVDAITGSSDKSLPVEKTPAQIEAMNSWDPGHPEFEAAMRHSSITRTGFKKILNASPGSEPLKNCHKWRVMKTKQRNLYRARWDKGQKWNWPGCILGSNLGPVRKFLEDL